MPISGTVTEINEQLIEKPEMLNETPFDEMWLIKITPSAYEEDIQDLMKYDTYKEEVK